MKNIVPGILWQIPAVIFFFTGILFSETDISPWVKDPILREISADIVFHLSFDGGNMQPEMASGSSKFQARGNPRFVPGFKGLALAVGGSQTGLAFYENKLNFPIGSSGTMIMWVCPVAWTHYNGPNTVFAMTSNSSFYIERQGPGHNEKGELTRQEGVLFLINTPTAGNSCLNFGTANWQEKKWRMLAAVWNWPEMAFSVDAGTFAVRSVKQPPLEKEFGSLIIGASGGEETLLDEVYIFKRPLTHQELKTIYQLLGPPQN